MHSADIILATKAPVQLLSHFLANFMKKLIVSFALAASLVSTGIVAAQAYYPSNMGCISVQTGLGIGARGSGVSTLQTFLVAQNYPGGGAWMITGYFGAATAAALRNFQQTQGLPQSSNVDTATASAISRATCNGTAALPSLEYPYSYPTIPTSYPSSYSYPSYLSYGNAPTITSLSQNTGTTGNVVTVYGIGFDQYNNTVNFGGTSLVGIPSQDGISLTFTVPSSLYLYSLAGSSVQINVANSRGTSNTVNFTVWGNPYPCQNGVFGYGNCGGCNSYQYQYSYGYNTNSCYAQPVSSTPVITYLSTNSGVVGTSVTVYGSGFSTSGNSINFGAGVIANVPSNDGRAVSFTIPSYLTGFGSQPITLSTYQVSVTNAQGIVSNAVPFAVTSLGSFGQPVISSVAGPTSLATGQQGVWTINVNTGTNGYLTFSANWGDQNGYSATPTSQQYGIQQQNTLMHTYYTPGTYTIVFTVWNSAGQQNSYTTTVVVGGNGVYGTSSSISYLSPSVGSVGQQITIYGSGFASTNTVNFGGGVLQNVYSSNGSVIIFTVPSSIAPSCAVGAVCPQYVISVTPGTYNVSVMNQNGTSNTVPFTVQ